MAALDIKLVQGGTISLGATAESNTATITAVVLANTFLLIDARVDENDIEDVFIRARLSDTTTITIDRAGASSSADVAATVRFYVVEFNAGLTVTHLTGSGSFNTNQSIGSTVDLGKTFGIFSYKMDFDQNGVLGRDSLGLDIVSTTNFQVKASATTREADTDWAVQIVEFDSDAGADVSAATIVMTAVATNTATIPAVVIADSMFISSSESDENNVQSARWSHRLSLDDTTTLRATRASSAQNQTAYGFVIDWPDEIEIRNGTSIITFGEGASESITITALTTTDNAIAFRSGGTINFGQEGTTSSGFERDLIEIQIDSTTQITSTRDETAQTSSTYQFQVVGFDAVVADADVLQAQVWM